MSVNEKMKKALSILLCLCMLVQNAPMVAFAADGDNLCEHHPEHTAECGYEEGVSDCTHHCDICLGHDHGEETQGTTVPSFKATAPSTEPTASSTEPTAPSTDPTTSSTETSPVCNCGTDYADGPSGYVVVGDERLCGSA